ncbi:hypothetical protein E4U55_008261 [Claviceps digitariae]|nr:hypothetical protein E4U55_008261 [Claviceps digitariae]
MDAATIEETNRIRVSLGMKPLPVPGATPTARPDKSSRSDDEEAASTLESRQAESYENYKKHQDAEAAKKKREERAAAIRKARDEAQRFAVLEGKTLGDADDKGDVDAKSWLMGQKKRQKKIDKLRKLEEELAAAEAAAAAAVQYTSKDLAGIKVAHDTSQFLDGQDQVLTLKDTTIDENEEEGDELENLDMREDEKLSQRLDLKKKRHGYNPNDDDGEEQKGILSQYDEEIFGKKGKKFTLDGSGTIAELADILGEPAQRANNASVNLDDIIGDAPVSSDYLAPSEIKIKKPKKKKSKSTRRKQYDDDDIFPLEPAPADSSAMEVDSDETTSKKRKIESDTFVDDDDLQASLSLQRRMALKKRKKVNAVDLAKQLKQEDEDDGQVENEEQNHGGLVIGEISEFVSNLSKRDDEEERKHKRTRTQTRSPPPTEDHPMENGDDNDDYNHIKQEDSTPPHLDNLADTGVEEEKTINQGMGAALSLLRERGLLQASEENEFENFRTREEFLRRKRLLEEELEEQTRQQRERDRASGRLDRMTVQNRDEYARQQNQRRDQQQSLRLAELFSASYKPNVQLKYSDEHGRSLDQKEAFKHLSHQFHGKGSGKGKTEKRLKRIDDEKRREAQSLFDASANGGMSAATAQQLKKRREAGVRLG